MRTVVSSLVLLAAAALLGAGDARGQGQEAAYVRVDTNHPQALLYADSLLIGTVSSAAVPVPAHSRTLRLVSPDVESWSVAPISQPLDVEAGDTVHLVMDFPYHYRIESIPFGAEVMIEDGQRRETIGETPLLYRTPKPLEGNLVVRRDGYAVERLRPGTEVWNRHVVGLEPSDDLDPTAAQVSWQPPKKHRAWIDYAAVGVAVAAGALAVHYKFRADDLYAEYEETGKPSLRSEIERYDVRAGIAFGAMQVGVGVFALRLVLR